MPSTRVNVSVDDTADYARVVKDVSRVGLKVEHELTTLRLITGSIELDKLERLRRVPGVVAVEESRDVYC